MHISSTPQAQVNLQTEINQIKSKVTASLKVKVENLNFFVRKYNFFSLFPGTSSEAREGKEGERGAKSAPSEPSRYLKTAKY